MKTSNIESITSAIQAVVLDEIGPEGTPEFTASEKNYWKVVELAREAALAVIEASFCFAGDPTAGLIQRSGSQQNRPDNEPPKNMLP